MDNPIYIKLKEIWLKYMNSSPYIDSFFMEYTNDNNQLDEKIKINGNMIYIKGSESYHPGIRDKTIECINYFLKENIKYDFIIRTNLSSFWNFSALLQHLDALPKNNVYSGIIGIYENIKYASGCGFIITPDIAKLIVENKNIMNESNIVDDVDIGYLINKFNIPYTVGFRKDFYNNKMFEEYIYNNNIYHYRIKYEDSSKRNGEYLCMLQLFNIVYKNQVKNTNINTDVNFKLLHLKNKYKK